MSSCYDPKLEYITAQLKRARSKRYESYVINRIWGLVHDLPLVPRTQMYVRAEKNKRFFVDLCFPEIGLAIEVDEMHHAKSKSKDRERERMITASDVIDGLYEGELEFHRIHVYECALSDIEKEIEKVSDIIRAKATSIASNDAWLFLDPKTWCKKHSSISSQDLIRFNTIKDACNYVFGTSYKGSPFNCCFTPRIFKDTKMEGTKLWFPQLAIDGQAATKTGWKNEIDRNDGIIIEEAPSKEFAGRHLPVDKEPLRIVFVKDLDPLTGKNCYHFAGTYRMTSLNDKMAKFERESSKIDII